MEKFDVVAKPSHYAEGRKYEPKDVIRDWGLNFNLGSSVKYISRAGRKDDILQDLKKAKQFLEFEIDAIEKERTAGVRIDSAAKMTVKLNANASTWIPTDEEQRKLLLISNQKWCNMIVETNGYCTLASIIDTLGFDSFPKHSFYGFVKGGERVVLDYDPESEFITITANRLPEN